VKGFGIGGFIGLVELRIVYLERNKVTGHWILADMRYSYGRVYIVARNCKAVHNTNGLVIEIQC
jgi:hypothetical protein